MRRVYAIAVHAEYTYLVRHAADKRRARGRKKRTLEIRIVAVVYQLPRVDAPNFHLIAQGVYLSPCDVSAVDERRDGQRPDGLGVRVQSHRTKRIRLVATPDFYLERVLRVVPQATLNTGCEASIVDDLAPE